MFYGGFLVWFVLIFLGSLFLTHCVPPMGSECWCTCLYANTQMHTVTVLRAGLRLLCYPRNLSPVHKATLWSLMAHLHTKRQSHKQNTEVCECTEQSVGGFIWRCLCFDLLLCWIVLFSPSSLCFTLPLWKPWW